MTKVIAYTALPMHGIIEGRISERRWANTAVPANERISFVASSDVTTKTCSSGDNCIHPHGEGLPATREYFYADKRAPDGLYSCCKVCFLARAKKSRDGDIERTRAVALASYYRHHEARIEGGKKYRAENRAKEHARHKQYYQLNKTKIQQYQRDNPHIWRKNTAKWRAANPEHAKMLARVRAHKRRLKIKTNGGELTPEDVALQLKTQKGLCWWCGSILGEKYDIDHRIPIDRGGRHAPENIVIAHPKCNQRKSNKLPQEWNGRLL